MQCKKNRVLVSTQLSEGKGRSLTGAVYKDKSRGKLNLLWRDFCWEKEERERVKRRARDRGVIFMLLMKNGGEGAWVVAERRLTTTSGKTSASIKKRTSGCRVMHWPDWLANTGGRCLLTFRERSLFRENHEERREEEIWTAE